MDKFEQKYGFKEDSKVENFHQSRRMFCFYQGKLYVADANLPYSHATWFEKEGWMTKEEDGLMNEMTRGIVDSKGDVYFYIGYDFNVNDDIEAIFFSHIKELSEQLNLDENAHIYWGLTKSAPGTIWPPVREYGKVGEHIKKEFSVPKTNTSNQEETKDKIWKNLK